MGISVSGFHRVALSSTDHRTLNLKFGNVGFSAGRKTGVPLRKTLGAGTTNNKINPHNGINTRK